MEDLDKAEVKFRPCSAPKCGYQVCLFCYRHIVDDLNGLCPACRRPYNETEVQQPVTSERLAEEAAATAEEAAAARAVRDTAAVMDVVSFVAED
eukprot:4854241-Prymnesium_polylepis.1